MSYDIEGKLHKVFAEETKGESFRVRDFVIETDGQYPQFVKFQLTQDRCSAIDGYKEGEMVKVSFDLRGREWNEKYFTNLNAWRIEKAGATQAPAPGNIPVEPPAGTEGSDDAGAEDDLPF